MIEFSLKMIMWLDLFLKGATIDDLTFKEYNVELNGNEKITLLSQEKLKMVI